MNTTIRDDFFTLIHKGQRQELFVATIKAGTVDWDDLEAAAWVRLNNDLTLAEAATVPA
jgi:hypothetical protein